MSSTCITLPRTRRTPVNLGFLGRTRRERKSIRATFFSEVRVLRSVVRVAARRREARPVRRTSRTARRAGGFPGRSTGGDPSRSSDLARPPVGPEDGVSVYALQEQRARPQNGIGSRLVGGRYVRRTTHSRRRGYWRKLTKAGRKAARRRR